MDLRAGVWTLVLREDLGQCLWTCALNREVEYGEVRGPEGELYGGVGRFYGLQGVWGKM